MPPPAPAALPAETNPLFEPSTLPYQAPQFDRIKDSDFEPAIEEGMKRQLAEIEAIADDPAPPTFENTIVAMEKTGQMLTQVELVFNALTQANTDDTLQKVQETEAPKLAAHHDAIYLNNKLFKRVEAIYDRRDTLNLDPEARMLIEVYHHDFVQAGAKLSDADKVTLRDLNEKLSVLETAFNNKLLAGTKDGALVVDDKSKLAGMSDGAVAAAAEAAQSRGLQGKWVIPLQNTTQQPSLQSLNDRAVREELFMDSWTRTEKGDANDTSDTIATMASFAPKRPRCWASRIMPPMCSTTRWPRRRPRLEKFLSKLVPAATAKARGEAKDIQAVIDKNGKRFKLEPWDWDHYAEQVRKAKYDLDEEADQAVLRTQQRARERRVLCRDPALRDHLQGAQRHPRLPAGRARVRGVRRGRFVAGLMYFDYFKRDNKSGGAWMDNFVGQSKLLGTKPVIYNVANFTKPAPGQPALLTLRRRHHHVP